ncbi:MAG: hypothetical protein JO078_12170 [Candidatus Eremiobacteraeota bacterium]|nr:hypothetical protein [Candidatus Eremiobacteraeota bacterium]MBV9700858.1 hypothetical protein [Candidatus Eremiobacteraeota bacterium]
MSTSTVASPSARAAFSRLIDYAGLFPPAQLSLPDALAEYDAARRGPHAWMLGRFIIPGRLASEGARGLERPFSAIVQNDPEALLATAALRKGGAPIESLEIPLPTALSWDETADAIDAITQLTSKNELGALPIFVELPRSQHWPEIVPVAMEALERAGLSAKLRCGGVTPADFPTIDEVAEFIAHARKNAVPFKATAGLHHPVRHLDAATGTMMHGFLNVIAAAALAPRIERDALVFVLAEEDAAAFRFDERALYWRDERIEVAELEQTRRSAFVSYGSCSLREPIDDLTALGMLQCA